MKLESKIFDRIRVKPDEDRLLRDQNPPCEWPDCEDAGTHRAPKGRGHDGEYHLFCLNHVREYNRSYNYFSGMDNDQVIDYQKSSLTGHRPTWRLGVNRAANDDGTEQAESGCGPHRFADTFGLFGDMDMDAQKPRRTVRNAERQALITLSLDETATPVEVKAQYKLLVKRHHPDANGGKRESEDKLREVIQAYDYLRSVGFC
ncbi:MAG: J domain-containing protein [Hyphomicrobiales bacterium]